jgi:hypothetical protein
MMTFEISCHAHRLRSISCQIAVSHAPRAHSPPIQQPFSELLPRPQPSLDILPRAASSPLPPVHTVSTSRLPLPPVSTYPPQPLVVSQLPLLRDVHAQLRRQQLRLQVSDARPRPELQLKAYGALPQLLASSAQLQLPQFLSSNDRLPQCAFASPVQG